MALAPGTSLGHYQIDAPLGAGGMEVVYRAKDTILDLVTAQGSAEPDRERGGRRLRVARTCWTRTSRPACPPPGPQIHWIAAENPHVRV